MSYFCGGNSGFNNLGFPGLGGNFNLGNNARGFNGLGYSVLNSGFNLGNNAQGFNGLGYGGFHSGFNPGNNAHGFAFDNNFGCANTQIAPRQGSCPSGCYRPMPDDPPCYQGYCPDGCCQMG